MATYNLTRVFRYGSVDMPDPCSDFTPSEALRHFARQFPKLLGGKVVEPVVEGDKQVFELRPRFGDKG